MKSFSACLLASLVLLCACNNKATSFLKPSNLESSFISIDADSAYTLKTGKGSIIKIAAGTFEVADGQKVDIEIKEAFTMQEILLAGLTTESNGRLLQSGGMIYFNATNNGKQLGMNKPVNISIPSETYDPNMQLFKGEIKEDSSINWIDPQLLDTTPNTAMILRGKALFKGSCASCHKMYNLFTGPQLAGSLQRAPNKQWLYDFIASPAKMIAKGDPYTVQLMNKWKPTVMTAFPQLGKEGVDAIYAYIENEVRLNPDKVAAGASNDSAIAGNTTSLPGIDCGYDTIFVNPMNTINNIEIIANSVNDTVPNSVPVNTDPDKIRKASETEGLREGFTDGGQTSGMYDFSIVTMGWYNIDADVEGYEGSAEVMLSVKLNGLGKGSANVYLFCPSRKMLSVGIDHGSNKFEFEKINGKLPLFLEDEAVIIAFGSSNEKMLYGTYKFKVAKSQHIIIDLKETTGGEINEFISKNRIDGIKIDSYKKEYEVVKRPCDSDSSNYPEKSYRK